MLDGFAHVTSWNEESRRIDPSLCRFGRGFKPDDGFGSLPDSLQQLSGVTWALESLKWSQPRERRSLSPADPSRFVGRFAS